MSARAEAGKRIIIGTGASALGIALAAFGVALAAPPAALLLLALLGARALMRDGARPRFDLPALAGPALATLIAGFFVGLAGAVGVLFVWRLYRDTRWSVGEAKRLAIAAGRPGEIAPLQIAHAWLTPLFGLCMVAFTAPHMVLGLPLDLPHVPALVPMIAGAAAGAALFDWLLRRAADWRLGELEPAPAAHLAAHHLLFLLAYGVTLDLSAGLVALIAWRLAHAAPVNLVLKRPETA